MYVRKTNHASFARRAGVAGVLLLSGCGAASAILDGERGSFPLDLSNVEDHAAATVWESGFNSALEEAEFIDLGVQPVAVRGRVDGADDIDVYDLGPVLPGDRVLVQTTMSGALKGAVALFDDAGASLLVNDHRNVYLGRSEPFIELVLRRPGSSCWVAVASTPGFDSSGDYALVASVEAGWPVPQARPQRVLLDFAGGDNVRIGSRPAIDIPPFDASTISDAFSSSDSEAMIAQIVATVRADYEGFNVTIASTSEGARDDGFTSRIYFGTFDVALLGVAEGVDEYNSALRQKAVVFTDTFGAFARLNPSVAEMSQAIGNVASHEIGHLLGLVHTRDPHGLMDVTASLRELMRDQSFRKSEIYSAVFPIGFQDAVQTLLDTVGGDAFFVRLKEKVADRERIAEPAKGPHIPARVRAPLSSCGLD